MSIFDDVTTAIAPKRRHYEQLLRRLRLAIELRRATGAPHIEDTTGQLAETFAGALPDTLWRPLASTQEDA